MRNGQLTQPMEREGYDLSPNTVRWRYLLCMQEDGFENPEGQENMENWFNFLELPFLIFCNAHIQWLVAGARKAELRGQKWMKKQF